MNMKKKVLCIFSLILYLLVACTIISHWIEDQMMTQVTISERKNRGDGFSFKQSVLFTDDQGKHLYEIIDGTGWNSGLRASMLPDASWYINAINSAVEYDGNNQSYRFITSASRMLTEGDPVEVVESIRKADDQYLCIFTDGIPEELILPKNAEIAAQNETVLLLSMTQVEFPFFEHTAKGLTDTTAVADKIISLTETEQFLAALPSFTLVTMILLTGVILWAFTCFLSIRSEDNKWLIRINVLIMIGLLCSLAISLRTIDLPASILPPENIFDLDFYQGEFITIFCAIDTLASESHDVVTTYWVTADDSKNLMQNCCVVMIAFIAVESIVSATRNSTLKRRTKYVGRFEKKHV